MRRVLSTLVVMLIVALGLAACGDDDGGADDGGGEANTVKVTAEGSKFDPTEADAKAGDVSFQITNKDSFKHTFTIDDTHVDIALDGGTTSGAQATLDAGTYEWHCTIHSSMKGTLTVS